MPSLNDSDDTPKDFDITISLRNGTLNVSPNSTQTLSSHSARCSDNGNTLTNKLELYDISLVKANILNQMN